MPKVRLKVSIHIYNSMTPRKIEPGKRVPFVWYDQTQPDKKIILKIDGRERSLVIDKIFTKEWSTGKDTV